LSICFIQICIISKRFSKPSTPSIIGKKDKGIKKQRCEKGLENNEKPCMDKSTSKALKEKY